MVTVARPDVKKARCKKKYFDTSIVSTLQSAIAVFGMKAEIAHRNINDNMILCIFHFFRGDPVFRGHLT